MPLTIVLLVAVGAAASPPQLTGIGPHIRPLSSEAGELLQQARRRSPTIADLASTIDVSDVIVFLDVSWEPSPLIGRTTIFGASDQARFLHVWVSGRLSADRVVQALGHELQHVVEIAQTAAIRDTHSLGLAYSRMGWQFESGHFETDQARLIEELVGKEIAASRPTHKRRE